MSIENPNFENENLDSKNVSKISNGIESKISENTEIRQVSEIEEVLPVEKPDGILLEKRKLRNMLVLGFSFLFIFAGYLTAGGTRNFS